MRTNKPYIAHFEAGRTNYGMIVVPAGVAVTHQTACGIDKNYHFVNEFGWIDRDYPNIAKILKSDMDIYGLDVPSSYVDK